MIEKEDRRWKMGDAYDIFPHGESRHFWMEDDSKQAGRTRMLKVTLCHLTDYFCSLSLKTWHQTIIRQLKSLHRNVNIFSRMHATLQPALSFGPSVGNTLLFFVFLGQLELFWVIFLLFLGIIGCF